MMLVLLLIVCHLSIVHSFHARYPSLYSKISLITAYNSNDHTNKNNNNINNIITNNNFFFNRHHHHRRTISSSSSSDDLISSRDNDSRMLQKDLSKMILPVIISLVGYSLDFTSLSPSSSLVSTLSSSSSVFHRSGLIANADDSNAGTKSDKSFELCKYDGSLTLPSSLLFSTSFIMSSSSYPFLYSSSFITIITIITITIYYYHYHHSQHDHHIYHHIYLSGISKCVFEETKPPPVGSSADRLEAKKSRSEIIKECRKKCAKTSEQLLIGSPKTKITKANTADGQQQE